MGLTIMVGALADACESAPDEVENWRERFEDLNAVLVAGGLPPHIEPEAIRPEHWFAAQMIGYGGLHAVRRLAAHVALKGRLPRRAAPGEDCATDPLTARLSNAHLDDGPIRRGRRFFGLAPGQVVTQGFQHLLLHSDCTGFYIPLNFSEVVFDLGDPPKAGLGGMVGSTVQLLNECEALAAQLDIPEDLDHEALEVWENADAPHEAGALWQQYGIETFGLTRLLAACRQSMASGCAIVFA